MLNISNSLFQICWATATEKNWILLQLRKMRRQTMNVRLMRDARFVIIKAEDGTCIGWAGLDIKHDQNHPELFSLYLDPDYRKYSMGMLLELARTDFLQKQGIQNAFVRMTQEEAGAGLLEKRLASGFYTEVDPASLNADYVQLCQHCELHGKECSKQVFLKFDIEAFQQQCVREIGQIKGEFPRWFRMIRIAANVRRAIGAEHEEHHLWKSYRPLWLSL